MMERKRGQDVTDMTQVGLESRHCDGGVVMTHTISMNLFDASAMCLDDVSRHASDLFVHDE